MTKPKKSQGKYFYVVAIYLLLFQRLVGLTDDQAIGVAIDVVFAKKLEYGINVFYVDQVELFVLIIVQTCQFAATVPLRDVNMLEHQQLHFDEEGRVMLLDIFEYFIFKVVLVNRSRGWNRNVRDSFRVKKK